MRCINNRNLLIFVNYSEKKWIQIFSEWSVGKWVMGSLSWVIETGGGQKSEGKVRFILSEIITPNRSYLRTRNFNLNSITDGKRGFINADDSKSWLSHQLLCENWVQVEQNIMSNKSPPLLFPATVSLWNPVSELLQNSIPKILFPFWQL